MLENQKFQAKSKFNLKTNNISRNYLATDKNAFNDIYINNYVNATYNKQLNINLDNINNENTKNNTEISKIPPIILNKSHLNKNKSLSKYNFDEVLNFNFGSQKPAQLKLINTSMLASPNKKMNVSIKSKEKPSSLFKKSKNLKFNQSKYHPDYSLSPIMKNKTGKNKKKSFLSEDKFIKNNHGMYSLPLLSTILKNEKLKIKPNMTISNKEDKDDMNIKKYIEEKNFEKIKKIIDEDNEKTNKNISEKLKNLEEKIKKYKLKRPNEETEEGIEKLYKIYNEKRGKRNHITTNITLEKSDNGEPLINIQTLEKYNEIKKNKFNNILMDHKGNTRILLKTEEEKNKPEKLTDFEISTLANRANRKVEKKFPDLCAFNLPKILRQNKEYNLKLLYDVFIEFKSLLKCGMVHNRNLSLYKQGIDFDTFFNCNTKINQQGIALSRKIYKAFNNKTNLNFMSWQNYFDGMMKIKDQNIDNKLDLFFQILDENGDGSFDYNEVYNLSLISLQRVLPNNEKKEGDSKKEENEEKDEENITHILAEFLTKYVFELVGIDIDGEIPIELLRAKMDERDDKSEYLDFFFCADNFA